MWAGVRLGLQILRVCLWWTGRFDSDSLPPMFRTRNLRGASILNDETSKAQTFPGYEGSQAIGTRPGGISAPRATSPGPSEEATQT